MEGKKGVTGVELSIKEGRQFTLLNRMTGKKRRIESVHAVDELRRGADNGSREEGKGRNSESESESS